MLSTHVISSNLIIDPAKLKENSGTLKLNSLGSCVSKATGNQVILCRFGTSFRGDQAGAMSGAQET